MRSRALWRQHSSGRAGPRIQHAAGIEADAVVERGAANETHVPQLVLIDSPAEGAGKSDLGSVALRVTSSSMEWRPTG